MYKAYTYTQHFFIELTKTIVITNDVPYSSRGSAKRAANQIAKKLGLELKWIEDKAA